MSTSFNLKATHPLLLSQPSFFFICNRPCDSVTIGGLLCRVICSQALKVSGSTLQSISSKWITARCTLVILNPIGPKVTRIAELQLVSLGNSSRVVLETNITLLGSSYLPFITLLPIFFRSIKNWSMARGHKISVNGCSSARECSTAVEHSDSNQLSFSHTEFLKNI